MLDTETTADIDDLVYDWLATTRSPGASLVVTTDSEELYATGFGARDLDSNTPTTPDTLYGVASVTKSFTTLAVLQQVERGEIDFDASITEYVDISTAGATEITVEDLLSHRSGLPNLGTSEVLLGRLADLGETGIPLGDREDLYHFLKDAGGERDDHSIGRFLYNNTAYTLLSHAVEATSDQEFEAYVETELLEPLGMDRSTFDADAFEADEDHATPHKAIDDGFESTRFPARKLSKAPGGLLSSPRELGQYLRFNLQGGEIDGNRLVSEALLARAHEKHVDPLPRYGDGYGYGWMRRPVAGARVISHGGSLLTSSSAIGFLPEEEFGVALCCASQPNIHPTEILEGIIAIIQGESPESAVPTLAYHDRIDTLTGEYESYRGIISADISEAGGYMNVTLQAGALEEEYVLIPDDPTLEEWSFTVPQAGRGLPVEFVETTEGVDLFWDRYRLHKRS